MSHKDLTPEIIAVEFATRYRGYYAMNDSVHRERHHHQVMEAALDINRQVVGGVLNNNLLAMAAWSHDLFAHDRTNHHRLAEIWVLLTDDPILATLTDNERGIVSRACAEHRASYTGEFTTSYSGVISAADRGFDSVGELLHRSIVYTMENHQLERHSAAKEAARHLQEKYGRLGYARLPAVYKVYYECQLKQRYEQIDALTTYTAEQLLDCTNI